MESGRCCKTQNRHIYTELCRLARWPSLRMYIRRGLEWCLIREYIHIFLRCAHPDPAVHWLRRIHRNATDRYTGRRRWPRRPEAPPLRQTLFPGQAGLLRCPPMHRFRTYGRRVSPGHLLSLRYSRRPRHAPGGVRTGCPCPAEARRTLRPPRKRLLAAASAPCSIEAGC